MGPLGVTVVEAKRTPAVTPGGDHKYLIAAIDDDSFAAQFGELYFICIFYFTVLIC